VLSGAASGVSATRDPTTARRLGQWLTLAIHFAAATTFASIAVLPSWWSIATIDFLLFQFLLFEFVGALASLAAGKAWHVTRPGAWLRWAVIFGFAGFLAVTLWHLGLGTQESAVVLGLIGTIGGRVVDWSFRVRAAPAEGAQILIGAAAAFVLWFAVASIAMSVADTGDDTLEVSRLLAALIAAYYVLLGLIQFALQQRALRGGRRGEASA
jgi:hypothetical protein